MKHALVALVLLLTALGAAVLVAPALVATDQMNERIAAQLSRLTGRDVSFTGESRVRLFPSPRIELRNVRVAGPAGFESEPLAEIAMIRGRVSRLPLLLGRIEIETFELFRPRLHLKLDRDDGLGLALVAGTAPGGAPGDPAGLGATRIGNFIVRNGSILVDADGGEPLTELTDANFEIAWPTLARSVTAGGSVLWHGEEIEFNGSLAEPLALMSGRASAARLAATAVPLRFSFDGTLSNVVGPQLDGETTVTTPSIRRLIEWGGGRIGPGASLSVGAIRGRVRLVDQTLSISDSKFEIDGSQGEGTFAFKFGGDRPQIQATLAFGSLDLTPYWETFQAGLRSAGAWFLAPIDLSLLQLADIDLRISSPQMRAGRTRIDDVGGTVFASDGRLAVNVAQATLHGGRLRASLQGRIRAGRFHGAVQGRVTDMSAASAFATTVGATPLDGKASVSVELRSDGRNWGELVGELDGRVSYSVAGGTLRGIDVVRFARTAAAEPGSGTAPDYAGTTAFQSLRGTARVKGGLLTSDDTTMRGQNYVLDLSGTSLLAATGVRGEGRIELTEAAGPRTVPFLVSGTWFAPILARDTRDPDLADEAIYEGEDLVMP